MVFLSEASSSLECTNNQCNSRKLCFGIRNFIFVNCKRLNSRQKNSYLWCSQLILRRNRNLKIRIQQYQTILRSIRKNITRRSTYPSQFLNKKQQESVVRKLEYFDVFIASFSTITKNISKSTFYSKNLYSNKMIIKNVNEL